MGLAFKPNIDDLRESPAKYIAQRILKDSHDDTCFIVEPNIQEHKVFKLTPTKQAIDNADIIIYLVAHNEFKNIQTNKDKIVLDFCGVNN
jgi:UDP-N-acetyl-D-mannosaminuronic acid dehydrogenase